MSDDESKPKPSASVLENLRSAREDYERRKEEQVKKALEFTGGDDSPEALVKLITYDGNRHLLKILPGDMTVTKYAELSVNSRLGYAAHFIPIRNAECKQCAPWGGECDTRINSHMMGLVAKYNAEDNAIEWKHCDRWKTYKPRQRMRQMGVPLHYQGCDLRTFKRPTASHEAAYVFGTKYVGLVRPPEEEGDSPDLFQKTGPSLFVHGPSGVGKTHYICALLRELRERRLIGIGHYVLTQEFVELYHEDGDDRAAKDQTRRYRESPLLVIDNLDSELDDRAVVQQLRRIITERLEALRPCIIASQLELDLIRERLGPSLANRIREHTFTVELKEAPKPKPARTEPPTEESP